MPSEREGWAVEVTVSVREEFGERREVISWRDQTPPLVFQTASDIHGALVRAVRLVFHLFRFGDALFLTARNARRPPFNPKNPQGLG